METRDDDIEFDFFDDEPATAETQSQPRVRLRRADGRPGRALARLRPDPAARRVRRARDRRRARVRAPAPVVRELVEALGLRELHEEGRRDRVAVDRERQAGRDCADGLKVQDIVSKLQGIADNEQQNVQAAEQLTRPGRLRDENRYLDPGAPAPRGGDRGARERVPEDRELEEQLRRREPARPAGRPPARERRDLGRLLPRADACSSSPTTVSAA